MQLAAQQQLCCTPQRCYGGGVVATTRCGRRRRAFVPAAAAAPQRQQQQKIGVAADDLQQQGISRRQQLLAGVAAAAAAAAVGPARPAHAGLERYVKRKPLDPLPSYVPLVLEARDALGGLSPVQLASPSAARQALRSGAFAGLRDSIRALGQYAAAPPEAGGTGLSDADGAALVQRFFSALEAYDLLLYNAVREQRAAAAAAAAASSSSSGDDDGGGSGDGGGGAAAAADVDEASALDRGAAAAKLQAAIEALDALLGALQPRVIDDARAALARLNGGGGGGSAPAAAAAPPAADLFLP